LMSVPALSKILDQIISSKKNGYTIKV